MEKRSVLLPDLDTVFTKPFLNCGQRCGMSGQGSVRADKMQEPLRRSTWPTHEGEQVLREIVQISFNQQLSNVGLPVNPGWPATSSNQTADIQYFMRARLITVERMLTVEEPSKREAS